MLFPSLHFMESGGHFFHYWVILAMTGEFVASSYFCCHFSCSTTSSLFWWITKSGEWHNNHSSKGKNMAGLEKDVSERTVQHLLRHMGVSRAVKWLEEWIVDTGYQAPHSSQLQPVWVASSISHLDYIMMPLKASRSHREERQQRVAEFYGWWYMWH